MRKILRFVKRYWYTVLLIPVGILVLRSFPRFSKNPAGKPNVSRPPIDGSGGTNPDDWGALTPADVPADMVDPWDNIEPFGGWGDDNQPVAPAEPYAVDIIKPLPNENVEFAGGRTTLGGAYW